MKSIVNEELKQGLDLPDLVRLALIPDATLLIESEARSADEALERLADRPERLVKVRRYVAVEAVLLRKLKRAQGIRFRLADAELFVKRF